MIVSSYYVIDSYLVIILVLVRLMVGYGMVGLALIGHDYRPIPESGIIQKDILLYVQNSSNTGYVFGG